MSYPPSNSGANGKGGLIRRDDLGPGLAGVSDLVVRVRKACTTRTLSVQPEKVVANIPVPVPVMLDLRRITQTGLRR